MNFYEVCERIACVLGLVMITTIVIAFLCATYKIFTDD